MMGTSEWRIPQIILFEKVLFLGCVCVFVMKNIYHKKNCPLQGAEKYVWHEFCELIKRAMKVQKLSLHDSKCWKVKRVKPESQWKNSQNAREINKCGF